MKSILLKQGAEAKILLIKTLESENEDLNGTADGTTDGKLEEQEEVEQEEERILVASSNHNVKKKKKILLKHRFRKSYRIPELDLKLTRERVSQEAKMIERLARLKGVHTPCLYLVDMFNFTIYMEYIDAPSVRDFLVGLLYKKPKTSTDDAHPDTHTDADAKVTAAIKAIAKSIGQGLAKIHDIDVIHGDLTTSNLLIIASVGNESDHTSYISSYKIVWIDFGLSYMSAMAEDKGVDLYVLERAILSTHPTIGDEMFQTILDEYEIQSSKSKEVIRRFQEVRSRGRKRVAFG